MPNVLFVCGRNRLPKSTADNFFADLPGIEIQSVVLDPDVDESLTAELVGWADVIFLLEKSQREKLGDPSCRPMNGRRVICLDLPDDYDLFQPELVTSLRQVVRGNCRFDRRPADRFEHDPYQPRQRVIYFANDEVSGATVGRAGVIVRSLCRLVTATGNLAWLYRAYDLTADEYYDATSDRLLASDDLQPLDEPPHPARTAPAARILFEMEPGPDQAYLSGVYKLPAGEWERFAFLKTDDPTESYQLSSPANRRRRQTGVLRYAVPRAMTLDEAFVRAAISRIRNVNLNSEF